MAKIPSETRSYFELWNSPGLSRESEKKIFDSKRLWYRNIEAIKKILINSFFNMLQLNFFVLQYISNNFHYYIITSTCIIMPNIKIKLFIFASSHKSILSFFSWERRGQQTLSVIEKGATRLHDRSSTFVARRLLESYGKSNDWISRYPKNLGLLVATYIRAIFPISHGLSRVFVLAFALNAKLALQTPPRHFRAPVNISTISGKHSICHIPKVNREFISRVRVDSSWDWKLEI